MKIKIIFYFWVFFFSFSNCFSFDLKLQTTPQKIYKLTYKDLIKNVGEKNLKDFNGQKTALFFNGKQVSVCFLPKEKALYFYSGKKFSELTNKNIFILKNDIGANIVCQDLKKLNEKLNTKEINFAEDNFYDALDYLDIHIRKKHLGNFWFWKFIKRGETQSVNFSLDNLIIPKGKVKVKINFLPLTLLKDKKVKTKISINNKGNVNFKDYNLTFNINSSLLQKNNTVQITNTGEVGLFLDSITLKFIHTVNPAKIKYFSPEKISLLSSANLKNQNNQADYIAITTPLFLEETKKLAAHREKQGLKTKIVLLEDIFNEFNFGNFSPQAIQDFLRYTYENYQKPAPTYLVLIGDAVTNLDYLNTIPVYNVQTVLGGDAGSDNYYGLMDDKDDIPDIAIGRIPVKNSKELKTIIEKIIAYETKTPVGEWQKKILFSGAEDPSYGAIYPLMEKAMFKIFNLYVPYDYNVIGLVAEKSSPLTYIPEKFPQKIVEELNKGYFFFNFVGHGSGDWMGPVIKNKKHLPIFTHKNADELKTNGKNPLFLILACLTGNFDLPLADSLAEKLLKNKGGAIAIIASSRISDPYSNAIYEKEFLYSLFKEPEETLGLAFLKAKNRLIHTKDNWRSFMDSLAEKALGAEFLSYNLGASYLDLSKKDHLYLYNLIGDPATKLAYLKEKINLQVKKVVFAGQDLEIAGEIKNIGHTNLKDLGRGKVIITLESKREEFPNLKKLVDRNTATNKEIEENYKLANNKVLISKEVNLVKGKFMLTINIPKDFKTGVYFIKAFINSGSFAAAGSSQLIVK